MLFITNVSAEVTTKDLYLSSITLSQGNFEFDKDKTEYTLELEDKKSITIDATTENANWMISGTGNFDLNIGTNEFVITVQNEKEEKIEYKITIINKEEERTVVEFGGGTVKPPLSSHAKKIKIAIITSVACAIVGIICIVRIFIEKTKPRKMGP